jgi:hypothetical protein
VRVDEAEGWLSFSSGSATVLLNFSTEPRRVPTRATRVLLATASVTVDGVRATLPPRSAAVVTADDEVGQPPFT